MPGYRPGGSVHPALADMAATESHPAARGYGGDGLQWLWVTVVAPRAI